MYMYMYKPLSYLITFRAMGVKPKTYAVHNLSAILYVNTFASWYINCWGRNFKLASFITLA